MELSLNGKVAVVTGATSGIGRATAVEFGRSGASVVVAGRREDEGQETVHLIEEAGGRGTFVRTDVSSEADVSALMDAAVETYGRLDCAVNNAGREAIAGVVDSSEADFDAEVAVNAKGVFFCLKHEIRHMRQNGRDRQYDLRVRPPPDAGPGRLRHEQGSSHLPDADRGGRGGQAAHPRQ